MRIAEHHLSLFAFFPEGLVKQQDDASMIAKLVEKAGLLTVYGR